MDFFTIAVWVGTASFLIFSLIKDKEKTKKVLKKAFGMGKGLIVSIVSIVFLIGLVLTLLPPQEIAVFAGKQDTLLATVSSAAFGTITLIPAFIAFPLVGTLVDAGVGIVPAVAFLTTLTMVGVVTFPLEKKEFGTKFAITRNALSFVFAILIALVMGGGYMKALKLLKKNAFVVFIVLAYAALFIIKPDMGVAAVKNSGYYIKEMLLIMPVIFVLTALLDSWVPKHTIMKFLGKESRTKGMLLSLVLGAISAGPIYAAFPLCVMLHKKGASIRNLVIILSSWAVIKVPMLINEVKFLGLQFMAVRWALTVVAIIIFSWLTSKIVRDKDLPVKEETTLPQGVAVNREACMGCSLCAKNYPELFEMRSKKAIVKDTRGDLDMDKLQTAIDDCPVIAIAFHKEK